MPTWDWTNSGSVAGKQARFATLAVLSSETLGPLCFFLPLPTWWPPAPYALVRFHARVGISGTADWADGSCRHWRLGCAIVSV